MTFVITCDLQLFPRQSGLRAPPWQACLSLPGQGALEELALGAVAVEGTSPGEAALQGRLLGVNCSTQQGRKIVQNKEPMLTGHSVP